MSSVLLVRLGHLSVQEAQDVDGAAAVDARSTTSEGAGDGNRYRLQVAQIGVDLLRNVTLGGSGMLEAERSSIIDDTRLKAKLALQLPSPTSDGSSEMRRTLDMQAELEAVNVHASAAELCDIVKIAASWTPRWSPECLAARRSAQSSKVLMSGWLLVKGVSKVDGWCWRWVRVHPTAVHCCKSEEAGAAPDQVFPLDVGPLSSTTVRGIEVLALRLQAAGARGGGDAGSSGPAELLMYAGTYFKQWQWSIRYAQTSMSVLLDADASLVAMPEMLLSTPRSRAHLHEPPRKKALSICCSLTASALAVRLRSDEGAVLLDCRLDQFSGSFASETHTEWGLNIHKVQVGTAARTGGGGLTIILSQRASTDAGKAMPPFLQADMSLEAATHVPHVRVRMQAMDVCLDNAFVNSLLHVKNRVLKSLDASPAMLSPRSIELALSPRPTMEVLSPRSIEFALSPRNKALTRSGRCCSLSRSQAPSVFFPAAGDGNVRKVGLRVSFVTPGMSTECWDDRGNRVLRMQMSEVDLVQESYPDGSSRLAGSLGGLHVMDAFAHDSLYDRILTVSEDADKIVKFEMKTFNFFSISYSGYDKQISLTINRPEITLLFRVFAQLGRYFALFGLPAEQRAADKAGGKDLLIGGAPQTRSLAAGRGPTRVHIALEHPVLILPRSSLSHEKIVADLGLIEVHNVHVASNNDDEAPTVEWQVNFTHMKLETFSERGGSSVVTEDVNGRAKIGAAVRKPDNLTGPGRLVEVSVGEVIGRVTEAQYALLMSCFSQNMTERYINPAVSSAINGEAVATPDSCDGPREMSFKQLSEQVQQALSNMDLKRVSMQAVFKVEKLNVALDFAGSPGLDASTSSLTPLLQVVGKYFVVQFVKHESLAPDPAALECEDLLWQMETSCATLQVKDARPAMSDRALSFISTKDFKNEVCFLLYLSKTSSANMCLEIEFRRVEIVADAGLFIKFLGWIGEGGRLSKQVAVSEDRNYYYVLVRPGGFAVSTTLSDARIHAVTSFQEAQADGFVIEGTLHVYYARVLQEFQVTCRVESMTVASHRLSCLAASVASPFAASSATHGGDVFGSPGWRSVKIVKPCSLYYTLLWSDAPGCVPSVTTLDSGGCDAVLSHEDVCMLSEVISTLAGSIRAGDDGATVQVPVSKQVLVPRLLQVQADIGTLAFAFVAKSQEKPWMHAKIERVRVQGERGLENCYKLRGSLGSIEIIDTSVQDTEHPKILTGCDGDKVVSFQVCTYDATSTLFPGYGLSVKLSVTRPQITLLMRFINTLNMYVASFGRPNSGSSDTATATGAHRDGFGAADRHRATSLSTSGVNANSSNAMPFEMPAGFSAFDALGTTSEESKKEDQQSVASTASQARSVPQDAKRVLIEIEFLHPMVIIPRNSLVHEAFVADLGKIEVHNSVGLQSGSQDSAVWLVSLHDMRLDSRSRKGKTFKFVDKVDGSAKVTLLNKGVAASTTAARMSVDIKLHEVRGCLSDAQYGLLLSVFGQNFSERLLADASAPDELGQSMLALPEDSQFMDNLAKILQTAKMGSSAFALKSVYTVEVGVVELLFGTADSLDTDHKMPLMLATGKALKVRYDMLDSAEKDSGIENIDLEEKLSFGCIVSFESLEILDRTSLQPRAKPFLSVSPKVVAPETKPPSELGFFGPAPPQNSFAQDISREHGAFVLRFFKTHTFHSFIELEFREVEMVADAGLLIRFLRWIGNGGRISSETAQQSIGEFQYSMARPGALWVRTTLPRACINLVTCFEEPEPDCGVLGGLVEVHYAAWRGQNTLSVDIKDFTLTSRSSQRQTSNNTMQIVTPCVFCYSQVWYNSVDSRVDSRTPQVFGSAKDFSAMITYEDLLLARRIASNITESLRDLDAGAGLPTPPEAGNQACDETWFDADASTPTSPIEVGLRTPQSSALKRQETIRYAEASVAPEAEETSKVASPPKTTFQIFGNNIRLTLVDDYNGRWIPLIRLGIPHVIVSGAREELTSRLNFGVDYFHQPTSKWKSAVEPWEVECRYRVDAKRTCLHIDAHEDVCTAHLSVAGIESLRVAISSWTKDRRAYAILKTDDALSQGTDTASVVSGSSRGPDAFVPYTVRNLLAEPLLCILEDGEEHRIEPQQWLELTYDQVWRGAARKLARNADEHGINNHVCLQLTGTSQVFGMVSLDVEQATSYEIEPAGRPSRDGDGPPPFPLNIVCDLSRSDGRKVLSVSSMVTVFNGSNVSLSSGILTAGNSMKLIGTLPSQGVIAVPLDLARSGTLVVRPVGADLDYEWCNERSEGIGLSQIHDGSLRTTQAVDMKFQRLFGASFPADTTLLSFYTCANDTDGVLWQGVLYVTDYALCHYSNLIGGEMKLVIELTDIKSLRKVNTAMVFPNAIEVKTASKTTYFRTLHNRADTFRTILKALPNKSVAVRDDDVDDRARSVFRLEPGDVILAMHAGSMVENSKGSLEGVVDSVTGVNGYILLTTHHLLFMTTGFVDKVKMRWDDIEALEKRASMLVRNNAVLAQPRRGKVVVLSSRTWNRDKVFDEDMLPLWKAASLSEASAEAKNGDDSSTHRQESGVRCRTLTCNVVRAQATRVENDPADKNAVYSRQKFRARDSLTWTTVFVDAVTNKVGAERTVGNPCIIQLHAPWTVENLSSSALEVQFVDQTRSCVVSLDVAAGESEHVLGVDLRREVFLRLRMPLAKNKAAAWSEGFLVHTDKGKNEFEGVLELVDQEGHLQPVVIEVASDPLTFGFTVTLYNRYWMLNLTGLPMLLRSNTMGLPVTTSRSLPLNSAIGYDITGGSDCEIRVKGFQWSAPISIEHNAGESATFELAAAKENEKETSAVPNQRVSIEVSSSTGAGKFDRTIIITFAAGIMIENYYSEPLVIWQRATAATSYERSQRPTLWLDPGQARPFFPEATAERKKCLLSINVAAEDMSGQCAAFAVGSDMEPLFLRMSDGRVVVAQTQRLSANTGTIVVRLQDPSTCIIPHQVTNHTSLAVALKQKDSRKNLQLRVGPYETIKMVWPDPLLPKILQIVEIEGRSLSTVQGLDAQGKGLAVELDSVQSGNAPLFDANQTMLVKKLMQHPLHSPGNSQAVYVLRLANPEDARLQGCRPPVLVELRDFSKFVLGRNPVAEEDEYLIKLGDESRTDCAWQALVSRRHLRISIMPDGAWRLEDLSSTNGVYVNQLRVDCRVLRDGDIISIGGTVQTKTGAVTTPVVYVFEKLSLVLHRRVSEACLLHASVQLDGGTKVMHLTSREPRAAEGGADAQASSGLQTSVSLSTSGLRFIIENDDGWKVEKLLLLQLDAANFIMASDQTKREVSLTFSKLQLDNMFDPSTPFPVVMSIAPDSSPAFKLTLVERLGQRGLGRYFHRVNLDVGDPYLFAEDRLIAKIAAVLSSNTAKHQNAQRQGQWARGRPHFNATDASSAGLSTPKSAASLSASFIGRSAVQQGVGEELGELLMMVSLARVSGASGGAPAARSAADPYIYLDEIKWREWNMHLTVMLTGDDTRVLRRYCGRIVERMLRKIRLDDVVIKIPALDKRRLLRKQSVLGTWLSKKLIASARKSFVSRAFLFKGLDAYKDAFLGKQLHTQTAGGLALNRLVPLDDAVAQVHALRKVQSSESFSSFGNVASKAVGTVTGTVSVAGSVATTAASTAGAAAGFVAQTMADTVQGTPLNVASAAASTAKSAATSAAKAASSGVKSGFKALGSLFN